MHRQVGEGIVPSSLSAQRGPPRAQIPAGKNKLCFSQGPGEIGQGCVSANGRDLCSSTPALHMATPCWDISMPGELHPWRCLSSSGGPFPSQEISLHPGRCVPIPRGLNPRISPHPRISLPIPGSLPTPGSLPIPPLCWEVSLPCPSPPPLPPACKPLRQFCSKNFLALRKTLLTVIFLVWGTIFPKRG